MDEELVHSGTPQPYINNPIGSGRYRRGTGENPYQHDPDFLSIVQEYHKSGMSEKEIADAMGMTINELRFRKSSARAEQKAADASRALRLKEHGYSNVEIGRIMGKPESTIRNLLDPVLQERNAIGMKTANAIKESVDRKGFVDIGPGTENLLGVSETKVKTAVQYLMDSEGYKVHTIYAENVALPGKYTTVKILARPDVTWEEIRDNQDKVGLVVDYHSDDGGRTFLGLETPKSVDSSRIYIRYKEEGGIDKDGVIELRRGVEDLTMGSLRYGQARIAVDETHYLKGMAIYSDDVPDGYDIVFNTNKAKGTPKEKVFKELKSDPDNPFGSLIKTEDGEVVGQYHYIDKDGKQQLSAVNLVRGEGDWDKWSKTLASQFLSKQNVALAEKQLDISYKKALDEYNEISSLTNPEIKKKLLEEFADSCDSDAVHLKAAALPRQSTKVILPLTDIKDTEIYAPTYKNGEQVALVRYPHGGIFEIPVLTVNNKNQNGIRTVGPDSLDAVGIGAKAAAQLSGADFDGDTVIVIPTKGIRLRTSSPLEQLKDFDPKEAYPAYEGMPKMKSQTKQNEMGRVSNLITDMTIKGADPDEIARAVRHSMVVIDAEKHNLNYKQSYKDNDIAALKKKYQGHIEDGRYTQGASTLVSRASAEVRIPLRKEISPDPETGERRYLDRSETYTNKKGKVIEKTISSTQMYEAKDARQLSSGTPMEDVYATYANRMKSLANESRKEIVATKGSIYEPSARRIYENEVKSLDQKLNTALANKPYERQAQLIANTIVRAKKADNPDMTNDEIKKVKTQALGEARRRTGANKSAVQIQITDREWEAIQSGAVSSTKIQRILENTDTDRVKELATPRPSNAISVTKQTKIRNLIGSGMSIGDVAEAVGVSPSTVAKYM